MTIYFENQTDNSFEFDVEKELEKLINASLDYVECPYEVEVSVSLVDKDEIHRINKEFRDIDRPTDVLSFPMMEYNTEADFESDEFLSSISLSPETDELVLGDIVLCYDIILEQAEEYNHSIYREFSFLVTHSMLHLFGYDHMEDDERVLMEKSQKEILDSLGISRD